MTTDYLTPDEVASQLQVSRQVVYNWINDGRLRAVKAGRTLRIPHYALDAFLEPVHAGEIGTDGVQPEPSLPRERFTSPAQAAGEMAGSEVQRRHHTQLDVEHLLWALLQPADGVLRLVLQRLGIDPREIEQPLEDALSSLPSDPAFQPSGQILAISPRVAAVIKRGEELASQRPELQIDASHLLMAICEEAEGVSAQILHSVGITPERLRIVLLDILATSPAAAPSGLTRDNDWQQRIEQQLTRIENELAALRSMLPRSGEDL